MTEAKSTSRTTPQTHRRHGRALVALFAAAATVTGSAQALAPARAAAAIDLGNGCAMYEWAVIVCEDPDEGTGSDTSTPGAGTSASPSGTVDTGTPGPGTAETPGATGDDDQATAEVNPDEMEVAAAEARTRSLACSRLQERIAHMPHTHNGRPSNLPGGLRDDLYRRYENGRCGRR